MWEIISGGTRSEAGRERWVLVGEEGDESEEEEEREEGSGR